jgi:hypothetical protein
LNRERAEGLIVAGLIAASCAILAIGALNFAGELSEGFKEFLGFWPGMGSLSGKVGLAYALGLAVFFALFRVRSLGRQGLFRWTIVLFASTALSSLLILTPFIDLFT